jgi:hypothetical protein
MNSGSSNRIQVFVFMHFPGGKPHTLFLKIRIVFTHFPGGKPHTLFGENALGLHQNGGCVFAGSALR